MGSQPGAVRTSQHDSRAQRAMVLTPRLPPLPVQFTNPTLTVHLTFEYTR